MVRVTNDLDPLSGSRNLREGIGKAISVGRIEVLILSMLCILPAGLAAVGLVIVWLLRRDRVPFPYCAEGIRREARICRFCGGEVGPAGGGPRGYQDVAQVTFAVDGGAILRYTKDEVPAAGRGRR